VPPASASLDADVETGAGAAAAGRALSAMSAACAVLRGAAKSPAKTARWLRTTRRMLAPCCVDRQPKARGCLSRRRRGGNLDVFTIMSRRAAPKQASQTRKPNPQAKPASQTPKPNRSGSPSMSRLSASLDAGTIPGRFPAGAGRPSGGSLRRANQN
jgi:hypothetical protein